MTLEQLVSYLTTSEGETVNFVRAYDNTNGVLTGERYASAAERMIVTVGTDKTEVTLTVLNNGSITAVFPIYFDSAMVKVVDNTTRDEVTVSPALGANSAAFTITARDGYIIENVKKMSDGTEATLTANVLTVANTDAGYRVNARARTASDADAEAVAAAKVAIDAISPAVFGTGKAKGDVNNANVLKHVQDQVDAAVAATSAAAGVTATAKLKVETTIEPLNTAWTSGTNQENTDYKNYVYVVDISKGQATATSADLTYKVYWDTTDAIATANKVLADVKAVFEEQYSVAEYNGYGAWLKAITEKVEAVENVGTFTVKSAAPADWTDGKYITFKYTVTPTGGSESAEQTVNFDLVQ